MQGESAVSPRQNMMRTEILADATLSAMLTGEKVYFDVAPEHSPLPYILFGQTTENDRGYIGRPGQEGLETLHCWGVDRWEARDVYSALYRLFNKQKKTIEGHEMIVGTLSLVTTANDPTREASQAQARYRCRTINALA